MYYNTHQEKRSSCQYCSRVKSSVMQQSLDSDKRTSERLPTATVQGHMRQVPLLPGVVDFTLGSSDASPTLQARFQTSDLLQSRVSSLFSSPSLCQQGRAVEIQPPFPGEKTHRNTGV